MNYCIIRTDKIKTNATFTQKYDHNYRIKEVPNADPDLQLRNEELVPLVDKNGNPCNFIEAYNEKIDSMDYYKKHKVMKGSVKAIEVVTTFSREARAQIDIEEWKVANIKWLRDFFNKDIDKFGDNLISVVFHDDENGNAHCHAIIIPIDDVGKLSCSKYLNGRTAMHNMQDSYAKAMAPLGLKRGLKGSSAHHEDIGKFYGKVNEKMEVPEPEKGETAEAYHNRILEFVQTERADSLRKVMEMDRELRRQRDEITQRDMTAVKGAAHAEVASLESERNHLQQDIQDARQELQQIREEIHEDEKTRTSICRRFEEEMTKKAKEIANMNTRAREIHEKIGALEQAKDDLHTYRTFLDIMEFARKEAPLIAESVDANMEILVRFYNERELDIEK